MQELAEKKRMGKEISREKKWLRMISQLNEGKGVDDKFKKRLWKGVPEKFRSLVSFYIFRSLVFCAYFVDHKGLKFVVSGF